LQASNGKDPHCNHSDSILQAIVQEGVRQISVIQQPYAIRKGFCTAKQVKQGIITRMVICASFWTRAHRGIGYGWKGDRQHPNRKCFIVEHFD
jgi:hypothetical protein